MFGLPDTYMIRARIFPAMLAAVPAIALAVAIVSWRQIIVSHVVASAAVCVLFFAFADIARRRGKRLEPLIYENIGGKPSTTMLRHRDAALDAATKDRWVRFLASKLNEKSPTVDREEQDPMYCDAFYERCGIWLREHTRDIKKFKLIFEENVTYGFRRNLLGLKWLGLLLNATVVLICLAAVWFRFPISPDDDVTIRLLCVLVVAFLHAIYFLLAVNEGSVIEGANQYARQLLLGCEALQTGTPLKPAARAKKQAKQKSAV